MKKAISLLLVLMFLMALTSPTFAAAKELDYFSPPGHNVEVTDPDNMVPGEKSQNFPGSEWDEKKFPGLEWFPDSDWQEGDKEGSCGVGGCIRIFL